MMNVKERKKWISSRNTFFNPSNLKTEELFFDYGKKAIKEKRKMGHLTILKK